MARHRELRRIVTTRCDPARGDVGVLLYPEIPDAVLRF